MTWILALMWQGYCHKPTFNPHLSSVGCQTPRRESNSDAVRVVVKKIRFFRIEMVAGGSQSEICLGDTTLIPDSVGVAYLFWFSKSL